jgi:uncharacterized SAM-binding protein YcdF (DUF218 family)
MFFVLSKLFNVLISPMIWVVLLVLASFFIKGSRQKFLRMLAFVFLLIFSNGVIFNFVSGSWEITPVQPETLDEDFRTVVVLGGMATENMHNGLPRFARSSDRLWQGLWLLNTGYVDTLIMTGGIGDLFDDQRPEGELLLAYFEDVGLMDDRLMFESASRNTYENALFSAELFDQKGMAKKIVLVTSGFHIRRAKACFEKQGFSVEVFPADPVSGIRPLQWKDYIIPSAGVLMQWDNLFREWAGMIMYKINGYI